MIDHWEDQNDIIWPLLFLPFQKVGTSVLIKEEKLVVELRAIARQGRDFL